VHIGPRGRKNPFEAAVDVNEDGCLDDILVACERPRSLHVKDPLSPPSVLFQSSNPLPPNLRSLAVEPSTPIPFKEFMPEQDFRTMCQNIPKLQFLGYHIKEYSLHIMTWGRTLSKFMVCQSFTVSPL
jgi:hypothetical protein